MSKKTKRVDSDSVRDWDVFCYPTQKIIITLPPPPPSQRVVTSEWTTEGSCFLQGEMESGGAGWQTTTLRQQPCVSNPSSAPQTPSWGDVR